MANKFHLHIMIFISSLFIFLFVPTVLAKDKWINLQSKNFNVVSNADEKKTKELALKMEQFRYTLSQLYPDIPESEPIPVTVVMFKDDKAFNPFKPLYNGKRRDDVAGYFEATEDENIIAIDASSNEILRVIFHEYFHLLLSFSTNELPLWINEGLAELYSSFEIDKKEAVLGTPLTYHVNYLQDNDLKFIPLKTLIQVDNKSPIYNESDKTSFFYTQSWATLHYIMLSERGLHKPKLFKYLRLIRTKPAEQAFIEVFGSFEEMDRAIKNYISNKYYTVVKYPLSMAVSDNSFSIQPLNDAQTQYHLGNLLLRTGRFDEAEKYFQQATNLDTSLASNITEGLAFVALKRNNLNQAKEYFQQAISRSSKNYLVYYQYAKTLLTIAEQENKKPSSELAKEVISSARKSLELRPIFAPAYAIIALTQLLTGENYKEGIEAAKQAVLFAPKKQNFALVLAQLQLKTNDYIEAKKTLQPLLNSKSEETKELANQIMKQIDQQSAPKQP